MSFKIAAVAALAGLASTVAAHGYVQKIDVAGTEYWGFNNSVISTDPDLVAWYDTVTDNGYVAPDEYTNADIICHKGAKAAALTAPVNGGENVTFTWNTWPDSHKGPVITYLAKCDGDCSAADKTALKWFKIDAAGLLSGDSNTGTWATGKLIEDDYSWSVTIPDTIASGNYVARHEIIALHSAGSVDGAQNYPQCVNLKVTSSGSDEPEGTLGTSLYTETDAGIEVNIYYPTFTSYSMPGPTLYTGSSSGSSSSGSSSSAAASVASSTVAASSVASSSVVATSSAAVATSSAVVATSSAVVASSSIASNVQVASSVTTSVASSASVVENVVTATATDVVTAQAYTTVTAAATATQAVASLASQLPSAALTSTISAGVPTATASGSTAVPTKALPEGTTLEDLLTWVEYLFAEYFAEEKKASGSSKARRHARDLLAARK